MNVIEAKELAKSFGRFEAVKGVTFSIREGEIFGFIGPNGAGKTTTINMLCTLQRATSGSATINGFDVTKKRSQVRKSIGLVFQDTTLDYYLTAEENLRFHAYAYGVPRRELNERMKKVLNLVELWERRKESVRNYSGGMKRRLEIARGLLHHPRVLFLDEPTIGLDPKTRRRIWEYILELRSRENLTIFMTTHYMDESDNCDRIAIMDHGQIVALDTPDRLKDIVGGDVVSLVTDDNEAAYREIGESCGVTPEILDGTVSFVVDRGSEFLPRFIRNFKVPIQAVEVRRPTLDDVFLKITGHAIDDE